MCDKANEKELNRGFSTDSPTGLAQAVFAVLSKRKPHTHHGGCVCPPGSTQDRPVGLSPLGSQGACSRVVWAEVAMA